jgi:RNA polymerase sigma-70 factor (ECF subfamily)
MSVQGLTDEQIVARCRAGDPEAWNELVERFARYVHAICVRGFRLSHEDAEDVFQDVFAKTYAELPRLRDDSAIRPWLAQLTRRTCIDKLRRARPGADAELADVPDPSDTLDQLELALDVHHAMQSLGEPCHQVLDRFFTQDESYRAIGEALDLPAGTVASRISRCLDKLKAAMEDPVAAGRHGGR